MARLLSRPRPPLSTDVAGPAARVAGVADTGQTESGESAQTFACPRCGAQVTERFWGPCGSCRTALVAAIRTGVSDVDVDASDVEASRYEPAMHVVPNHVATKD